MLEFKLEVCEAHSVETIVILGLSATSRILNSVIDTTFAVVKRKPEKKIRLVRDLNPMTSAIPVQRSNQLS